MKNKEIEELLNEELFEECIDSYKQSQWLVEKQQKIEQLEEENKYLKQLCQTQNNREYRSKFLKEFQKEHGTNVFPDYDEIYKRYDNLKEDFKRHIDRINELTEKNDKLQQENKQLENNRDKAIEVINTQLKNAEGGLKDNLRIIKFNLIKGSCTFEDLKTEEDYKYILKGGSNE